MRISRKSDFALRTIRHLALLPNRHYSTIEKVAASESIPRHSLSKVLTMLSEAGFVKMQNGAVDSYRLSKLPEAISFLEVIEAIDGPVKVILATENSMTCPCGRTDTCEMCDVLLALEQEFIAKLSRRNFSIFLTGRQVKKAI